MKVKIPVQVIARQIMNMQSMILNKDKIINEILRKLKSKAGFDVNRQDIRRLKNDVRSLNSKTSRNTKEIENIKRRIDEDQEHN